jgi:outer membrane lipoprotein-sorting protein
MVEDAAKKHLFSVPEYILHIGRATAGSQKETPVRVVYFHRDDLLPYQQDVYDSDGNLETQVTYSAYQDFEGNRYPSTVTIKRPLEETQILLTVEDVHENLPIADDTFVLKTPEGATVVNRD